MLNPIIILLGGSIAQPQPATMHVAKDPPAAIARTSTNALDAALEALPEQTALAIVIPDPELLYARWLMATDGAGPLLGEWAADKIAMRVRRAIALEDDGRVAGIDPHGPAIFVPGFDGAPDVVRVTLADPARFAAWAATRGPAAAIAPWSDGPVYALASIDGAPLACAPRGDGVWCQLGASAGTDPLIALRRMIDMPSRRLAHSDAIVRAAARVRSDADAWFVGRPADLASLGLRAWVEHGRRTRPFQDRKGDSGERQRIAEWVVRAQLVDGIAGAISLRPRALESEVELTLSPRGAAYVQTMSARGQPDPLIAWAKTSALAHVVIRLDPAFSAGILRALDAPLPPELLSGSLAAMALGIDTECGAAKGGPSPWPFVFPVAAAIGLAGGRPLERERVVSALGLARDKKLDGEEELLFRTRASGGPIEGRLVSGALLIGTGPGSGAAARRRWSAAGTPLSPLPGSFLEAEASLPAIAAALAAGTYDRETRPELRRLESMMRALKPWAHRYPQVRVQARAIDAGARVRIQGSVSQ